MNLRSLLFTLLICATGLGPQTLLADPDTRELLREIIKLHGDISLSAGSLLLLSQQTELSPALNNADDATVLAALEVLNRTKFQRQDSPLTIDPDDISAARNKIGIYKMLCMTARPHEKIFAKYCSPPPYQDLYASYHKFSAQQ